MTRTYSEPHYEVRLLDASGAEIARRILGETAAVGYMTGGQQRVTAQCRPLAINTVDDSGEWLDAMPGTGGAT